MHAQQLRVLQFQAWWVGSLHTPQAGACRAASFMEGGPGGMVDIIKGHQGNT